MRRSTIVIGLTALAACLLSAGPAFAQDVPKLEIPIPGLEFSPIIRGNEEITIPWLAEYIGGVYTFLISIVGLVAAVVMIVGGFQYVTSAGDKGKIGAAKKRMADAFIGMLLVFGSYTLLYAINPELTSFEGLKVLNVKTDFWHDNFDATLGETEEVTTDESEDATFTSGGGGEYEPLAACPFTLTGAKGSKEAKLEFYSHVRSSGIITAASKRGKVLQVAAVADACDVNLGSCGATAGAINALAGVGDTSCLADASSCNDDSKGPEMFAISGRQRREIYGRNCALWSETKMVNGNCLRKGKNKRGKTVCLEYEKITLAEQTRRTLVSVWKKYTPNPSAKADEVKAKCFHKNGEAMAEIRRYLLEEATAGRLPKDWPDAWAKKLQPGDRLVVYNGNNDLVGAHALIFVGWATDKGAAEGTMNVIQGGNGGKGDQKNVTRPGPICVTKNCRKKNGVFTPLINGWRPD